jgi:hypothetical protein
MKTPHTSVSKSKVPSSPVVTRRNKYFSRRDKAMFDQISQRMSQFKKEEITPEVLLPVV